MRSKHSRISLNQLAYRPKVKIDRKIYVFIAFEIVQRPLFDPYILEQQARIMQHEDNSRDFEKKQGTVRGTHYTTSQEQE